jgi:hypothetical protein
VKWCAKQQVCCVANLLEFGAERKSDPDAGANQQPGSVHQPDD